MPRPNSQLDPAPALGRGHCRWPGRLGWASDGRARGAASTPPSDDDPILSNRGRLVSSLARRLMPSTHSRSTGLQLPRCQPTHAAAAREQPEEGKASRDRWPTGRPSSPV